MSTITLTLVLVGLLLIAALAAYAWHLWRRVWAQQESQAAAEQERRQRLGGDLNILASSLLDEQLPLIEGAIRIKVLLDNYDSALSNDARCQVFHQLFEATADVPTHAAWKALDKPARRRFEKRFTELELQHKAAARTAARWLLDEGLTSRPDRA
ncbi:DUF2489 domain-containing protein [Ectopseudomonas hydrolytica]|uniref:DUF2489 domain-containing protein n=1 Tax=Ectopseudomonas hydrolytica TaxID=2493633 RepID=UPI000BC2FCA6|nr:DUF2489 domain-containing protein [Pseudomonas sp. KHPS1]ATH81379.1 hypothetical protein CO724_09490 [Pseudomonas mendocina]UTH35105.1 DUF2489 domain-containing protein [Pseudomonas sp. KHPS1]